MNDAPQNPSSATDPQVESALADLRSRIDALDARLVALLNERAQIVVEIGACKRDKDAPIYAPHREAAVLQRVIDANDGPLQPRTIEAIYRELMSGSFALEQPLRIGYLGPPGSFSHVAATAHFGSSVAYEDMHDIDGVFTEVRRGRVDYALAPIENSAHGGVADTLDALRAARGEVVICAESLIGVRHHLLANCAPEEVCKIHSRPEVFSQCKQWLATQYPRAALIHWPSSSRAAMEAKAEHDADRRAGAAAIGSELAGKIYGLNTLFIDVEDDPGNVTRFAVVSRKAAQRTGDDKTSIMFTTDDKPGALVAVLAAFEDAGVNLSHIDKRPSGKENWTYTFFIDAMGHPEDEPVLRAIEGAERRCREVLVLGGYPKAKRIL